MADSDRTETLLALLLLQQMKSAPNHEKILSLNRAGFSNLEIANIVETTPAVVAQSSYAARKGGRKKPKKKAKKKPKKKSRR